MEHPRPDGAAGPVEIAIPLPKEPPAVRQHKATKPALPKELPEAGQRKAAKPAANGKLGSARDAARAFLISEFDAREVQVTKVGPSPTDPQGWYVEAEIMVPDLGMKSLGLPLTQEVLERELCAIDLDSEMAVTSCEVIDSRDQ